MNHSVRITTPSRLHFGLLRFAVDSGPSYGGLGMMIAQPKLALELQESEQWFADGPMAERALRHGQDVVQNLQLTSCKAFDIRVHEAPPSHAGLGSGTQLALAVAAGICSLASFPHSPLEALVETLVGAVGRGKRSAIGSHGFQQGGLLWETGYAPGESLSRLSCRIQMPAAWRILLITPKHPLGLHGKHEVAAFEQLKPAAAETTAALHRIAEQKILPAAREVDFNKFAQSVFEYGHLSGSSFASVQGGPYASPQIAAGIDRLRGLGVQGVGQSSWGPTMFAFCVSQDDAEKLANLLPQYQEFTGAVLLITAPDNQGAIVESIEATP